MGEFVGTKLYMRRPISCMLQATVKLEARPGDVRLASQAVTEPSSNCDSVMPFSRSRASKPLKPRRKSNNRRPQLMVAVARRPACMHRIGRTTPAKAIGGVGGLSNGKA